MLIATDVLTIQIQKQSITKIILKKDGIEIQLDGDRPWKKKIVVSFSGVMDIGNIIYDTIISVIISSDEIVDLRNINDSVGSIGDEAKIDIFEIYGQ